MVNIGEDNLYVTCINGFVSYHNSSKKYVTYIEKPISNFPSKSSSSDARVINSAFESLININKSEYMWSMRIFQTSKKEDRYPYGKY